MPAAGADFFAIFFFFSRDFLLVFMGIRCTCGHAITPCDSLSALLTVPCCTIDHLHSSRPQYPAFSDDLIVRPVGRCPSSACTLLVQCASPRIGCWHSRGYAYAASRAWAVKQAVDCQLRGRSHLREARVASILTRCICYEVAYAP